MLDDFENLRSLKQFNSGLRLDDLWAFCFSGHSGPLGRPLALLSFALQHDEWPSNPSAFKAVNLGLHFIMAFLLAVFFRQIFVLHARERVAAAFFPLLLWVASPLLMSSVFYVVQRMTLLSAIFSLLAIISWIWSREEASKNWRKGLAWLGLASYCGAGVLALGSKETAVLIPGYVLILEVTLLRAAPKPKRWEWVKLLLVWVPLILVLAYVGFHFTNWVETGYSKRAFTLHERLMTEGRVIVDYLRMAVFPVPGMLGLFHDDYPVSTAWSSPHSTWLALAFLVVLVSVSSLGLKRWPALSFGIGWFLVGHLLEATVIPLELYFEHRNYLPLAGLYLGMVLQIALLTKRQTFLAKVACLLGGAWIVIFLGISFGEARLWGRPLQQAAVWAEERPSSLRANEHLANELARTGRYREAAGIFEKLAAVDVRNAGASVSWLHLACYDDSLKRPKEADMLEALGRVPYSAYTVLAIQGLISDWVDGRCVFLEAQVLDSMLATVFANPGYATTVHLLLKARGEVAFMDRRYPDAIQYFNQSYTYVPDPELLYLQASTFALMGRFQDALKYLSQLEASSLRPDLRAQVLLLKSKLLKVEANASSY